MKGFVYPILESSTNPPIIGHNIVT